MGSQNVTYIGSFPPPYGGVTVKNALLYKRLSSILDLEMVDLTHVKRLEPSFLYRLARALLSRDGALVIGVSADWRYRLTSILYLLNKRKMSRSILMVMGGRSPESTAYAERMNGYLKVYVETEGMKRAFEQMGSRNVDIYPNCRERPSTPVKVSRTDGSIRCVFFSLVSPDKGSRIVLDAAAALPELEFHFYGRVEEGYEEEFSSAVAARPNVHYHGVFDSVSGDVVGELNRYDIHLFPTLCPNEGVPGVIAETKMAGIPTVASDRSYNGELVEDGVDGILTHEDSAEELVRILSMLSSDPERVDMMKTAALESSGQYVIDNYLGRITKDLANLEEEHVDDADLIS